MVLTIIKNKRGRFDGLDTKDKKAAADALSLKTDSVAVWVFDDDSLAIMTKMHQTLATKEVDVTLQTLQSTPEEHKVVLTSPGANLLASGMLFSGRRVSGLRCERQLAYVLRRLGGSERSTELARSTPTAVSLTTHPPRPGRMV